MKFRTLKAQPDGDEVRVEKHLGEPHLVAPVVLVREGVLNGGFLSFDEIAESVLGWDDRPVTAPPSMDESGHPLDDEGNFASARLRENLERQGVGFLQACEARDDLDGSNGENPNGLRGEVWVNLRRANEVGEAALEAARRMAKGEPLDVSTGYFCRVHDERGRFNGEPYDHEQGGLVPDHLALLPNEKGACSWADGCGAPRANERVDEATAMAVNGHLGEQVLAVNAAADGGEDSNRLSSLLDTVKGRIGWGEDTAGCAHSGACSCGEHTTQTMDDDDYEALSEATGVSVEALKNMDEDDLTALAEVASTVGDGPDDDGADDDGSAANDGGSTDTGNDDGEDGTPSEVETLREELDALREQVEADPRAEQARDHLAENTDHDREGLDEWPDEAVVEAARAHGFGAYTPPATGVNRLGQAGGPAGHDAEGPSDDEVEDLTANVGALAALNGGE